ncbi:MAG: hypothetical protein V3U90_00360 [Dehalococcoidia bacterium]
MLVRIHGIPFLAAVLALVLVAAACGGGEEAPPTAPAPTPTSVTGVAPIPTATATSASVITPGDTSTCTTPEGFVVAEKAICNMVELNNSGVSGSVTFTQIERDTELVIDITPGLSENDPQPTAIHRGRCADIGGVVDRWPLNGVVDGMSTSVIEDVPFSLIQFSTQVVVVSKSEAERDVLVSCGNIPAANVQ